jgi:hypothetical protein
MCPYRVSQLLHGVAVVPVAAVAAASCMNASAASFASTLLAKMIPSHVWLDAELPSSTIFAGPQHKMLFTYHLLPLNRCRCFWHLVVTARAPLTSMRTRRGWMASAHSQQYIHSFPLLLLLLLLACNARSELLAEPLPPLPLPLLLLSFVTAGAPLASTSTRHGWMLCLHRSQRVFSRHLHLCA